MFVYFLERSSRWDAVVNEVMTLCDSGSVRGSSSVLTLAEVLVKPLQRGETALADQYRSILLHARFFSLLPVGQEVAQSAARIRAEYGFRLPDSIQLASALRAGAPTFVTNDKQLRRFTEVEVVLLDDYVEPRSTNS